MGGMIWAWLLSLGIPLIVFFVSSLIVSLRQIPHYSFLTDFPFELFERRANSGKILFYVACGFDALGGAFLLVSHELHPQLLAFEILYLVSMVLKDVALAIVVSVPAYEFKSHIPTFTVFGAMTALSCALATILFANLLYANGALAITFAIIVGLLGLVAVGLLVNPKLAHWTQLNSKVEEDGTITTSRPRPFVLAFTEWLLAFISFGAGLLALIGFALVSLSQI
ncbi:MAG: hypothetical protein K6E59_06010 [Bacilli bacterium]|nr:hypothetical protein [Bacilli bacterium]